MASLVICNIVLIVSNWKRRGNIRKNQSSRTPIHKLTVIAVTVIACFIASALPYFIMKVLFWLHPTLFDTRNMNTWFRNAIISSYFLMHISSVINPVLYVLQSCRRSRFTGIMRVSLNLFESARSVRGTLQRYRSSPHITTTTAETACGGPAASSDSCVVNQLSSKSRESRTERNFTMINESVLQSDE